jgi:hypothetical protein
MVKKIKEKRRREEIRGRDEVRSDQIRWE